MNLGERLKKARLQAKLSQKQLEDRSGVSQKTISKIERGDQEGSTQIAMLARACGVRTDWLAAESGPMLASQQAANEPEPTPYDKLTPDAFELARVWSMLPAETRVMLRDLVFMLLLADRRFPWLRRGRPKSETYDEWERRQEQNFAAMLKLGSYPKGRKVTP